MRRNTIKGAPINTCRFKKSVDYSMIYVTRTAIVFSSMEPFKIFSLIVADVFSRKTSDKPSVDFLANSKLVMEILSNK